MKKLISAIMILLLFLGIYSCGKDAAQTATYYINISTTLIPKKDLGMINAITDKYLSDKNIL